MKDILLRVITEKGIYIVLAVTGFITGLASAFIDTSQMISIKWLILLVIIFFIILIIFFSILNKIIWEKQIYDTIKIVKFNKEKELIVLKTNQNISINSLLTIYVNIDEIEELQCLCVVENPQENKLISIKIISYFVDNISENIIEKGIVKTTIPQTILEEANNG
ncbi:hypothetical protein [Halarcobacter anaerophilus]|uniref:Uncharacterized protein n=1 Tax=Halarcobacter anaerophilus TaxID=877500 RepID=A0A4Q0XWP1_9BACT|nr:hypothetical protein [Halarcobacter anaerophilus]QDF28291.1 putative membrane protein [Halarcobacter anaerophilus]RXJ62040.1 hypothetical protein CRV06_11450 [Halarcobacter anaerophilus]